MITLAQRFRRVFPEPERRSAIWRIALPIMAGMMSQNLLNLVDIAMVGHLGDAALAATGIGGFSNYLAIAFIIGLSTGVQALAARRLGEGRSAETAVPLNGGLLLSLVIGLPACALAWWLAPAAVDALTDDPLVQSQGTDYLQVRLLAMVAVGMNFSFRGYWSAVHMTGIYLRTLLIMHMVNIFLHWVLIFGNLGAPALGVYGAGLSTTLSLYLGTALYFLFAWQHAHHHGFLHRLPSGRTLLQQLRLSLPASLQQLFFSAGLVTLIWIVGRIGTAEVAAVNVLMTFHLTVILPAFGIALATSTLVGNALGREDVEDAARWAWEAALLTLVYGLVLTLILLPLARPLLGLFLHDPTTRDLAWAPMLAWALVIGFDAMGMVLMHGLLGAGDTRRSLLISLAWQWAFFLPAAFVVGPLMGLGLLGVWVVNALYRLGQAWSCLRAWQGRRWVGIEI